RTFRRYSLWFPVTLKAGNREIWAICRDASAGGIHISSVFPLEIGTKVTARFRVSPNEKLERTVEAEVVRSDFNEGELMLAFPFRLGLRFAAAVPELSDELGDQIDQVGVEIERL
ncbi:MAG TPA: PilZ domain-containing protein, partial [Labilithrix sp.]|nr:PilZ domain-containing protein [Labilithrix sp.]